MKLTPKEMAERYKWVYWIAPDGSKGWEFPMPCRENLERKGWKIDPDQPKPKPYPIIGKMGKL